MVRYSQVNCFKLYPHSNIHSVTPFPFGLFMETIIIIIYKSTKAVGGQPLKYYIICTYKISVFLWYRVRVSGELSSILVFHTGPQGDICWNVCCIYYYFVEAGSGSGHMGRRTYGLLWDSFHMRDYKETSSHNKHTQNSFHWDQYTYMGTESELFGNMVL